MFSLHMTSYDRGRMHNWVCVSRLRCVCYMQLFTHMGFEFVLVLKRVALKCFLSRNKMIQSNVPLHFRQQVYFIRWQHLSAQTYPVFIEGPGHPVPERAQSPLNFGAPLHLLYTILLFLIPGRGRSECSKVQTTK